MSPFTIVEMMTQLKSERDLTDKYIIEVCDLRCQVNALREKLDIATTPPSVPITRFDLEIVINDLLTLKERLPS